MSLQNVAKASQTESSLVCATEENGMYQVLLCAQIQKVMSFILKMLIISTKFSGA